MRLTDGIACVLAVACASGLGADPAAPASPSPRRPVTVGAWGGAHAQMVVTPEETRVQLDCAHGVIAGPLEADKNGRVDALGSLVREGGGPGAETDAGTGEPARFRGKLAGKTLTLTITLVGPAQDVGTFRLAHGRPGRTGKCP